MIEPVHRDCTGCGLCAYLCPKKAIKMEFVNCFYYPVVDNDRCIHCGKCINNCPVNYPPEKNNGFDYFAGYQSDIQNSSKSTSGGIATAISKYYLEKNNVVYGATFDEEWNLLHKRVDSLDNIDKLSGSKYLQSRIDHCIPLIVEDLRNGKEVCFIGTPCQVSTIKNVVPKQFSEHMLLVDFICHGVPSPVIGHDYLALLEQESDHKLKRYNFRSKRKGWSPKTGRIYIEEEYEGGKRKFYHADYSPLHTWFGKHLSLRESCFHCKFRGKERCSDITIADFWGVEQILDDIPTKQGVSAIQVSTPKGQKIIETLANQGQIVLNRVTEHNIWHNRNTGENQMSIPKERDSFINTYISHGIEYLIEAYPALTKRQRFILRSQALLCRIKKIVMRR